MMVEKRNSFPLTLNSVSAAKLLERKIVTPEALMCLAANVMIQMDMGRGEPEYSRTYTTRRRYNPGCHTYCQFGDVRLNLFATDAKLGFRLTRYDPPIPPHDGLIMPHAAVINKNLSRETPVTVLYKTVTGVTMRGRHNIDFAMCFHNSGGHDIRPIRVFTQVPGELFQQDGLNPMGRIGFFKIGGLVWNIREANLTAEADDIISGDVNFLCKIVPSVRRSQFQS